MESAASSRPTSAPEDTGRPDTPSIQGVETDIPKWPRLARIRSSLACPACLSDLTCTPNSLTCGQCAASYPLRDGKIYFIQPPPSNDHLDRFKRRLKRLFGRRYYSIGVQLVAPTYPFNYSEAIRNHCEPAAQLIVDLGSGNNRVDDNIITLDSVDYESVDIVADLGALPFKSESIDGFASRSVLEHVSRLDSAVKEIGRCTRSGGIGIHLIPFLFPYHASPHDYQRLTHVGAATLFPGWRLLEQRNVTGPVTLFAACLTEFLAILLSFGRPRLKSIAYLAACLLLFPLKFLDAPFVGRRAFLSLAPTILTVVQKP